MHSEAYGKTKQLDINAARSYEEVGYPRAWAIFLMQEMVAQWLSAVVDVLSANAPPSGNSEWTAMVAEGLRSAHDQRLWSCYHHQEFTPPSTFDPNAMLKKARDHLNMLTEEIEELQTSPEAMRQYVLEEKANTKFKGKKKKGDKWQCVFQTLTLSWTRELERRQIQADDETAALPSIRKKKQGSGFVQQAWDQKDSTDGAVRKTFTKKSNAVHDNAVVQDGLKNLTFSTDRSSNNDEAEIAHIAVKQANLDILSQMFSTGNISSGVRWVLLLQALTDAGLAVTPGAGSAVSFANEQGTISIHQPHDRDGPVVDAIRLRGIGRRLTKWFGWTNETFVLREKDEKKP